jgi:hypothetical protein
MYQIITIAQTIISYQPIYTSTSIFQVTWIFIYLSPKKKTYLKPTNLSNYFKKMKQKIQIIEDEKTQK